MTDQIAMQHLEARLEATPVQTVEGLGTQLAWRVQVASGPTSAGTSGLATLAPPQSGLRVLFDYAVPGRLLGMLVPCGSILDTQGAEVGRVEGHTPTLAHLDAALLDALVGWEVRRRLEQAGVAEVSTLVRPASSWARLGRLALLQTVLSDDPRPLDGLWAAEAVTMVDGLNRPALQPWAKELVGAAAPALRLLPESWASRDLPTDLLAALVACRRVGFQADLGPLDRACREADELAVEAALAEIEATAASGTTWSGSVEAGKDDDLASMGRIGEAALLVAKGTARDSQLGLLRTAAFDHSALGSVRDASWEVTDGHLHVVVTPESGQWPRSFAARVQVRATTRSSGLLVAAGLALDHGTEGLEATLRLPFEVDPEDLFVCVGRHLPVEAITPEGFERRQARAFARERLAEDGGRPKLLAEKVGELLGQGELDKQIDSRPGERELAGARSLAWCSQHRADAARFELRRLEVDSGRRELTLEQSDRLIAAAATEGEHEVAARLDDLATEAYYDLIA